MKLLAPNKHYTGTTMGVRFVDGVGETSDKRAIARLKRSGYKPQAKAPAEPKPAAEVPAE